MTVAGVARIDVHVAGHVPVVVPVGVVAGLEHLGEKPRQHGLVVHEVTGGKHHALRGRGLVVVALGVLGNDAAHPVAVLDQLYCGGGAENLELVSGGLVGAVEVCREESLVHGAAHREAAGQAGHVLGIGVVVVGHGPAVGGQRAGGILVNRVAVRLGTDGELVFGRGAHVPVNVLAVDLEPLAQDTGIVAVGAAFADLVDQKLGAAVPILFDHAGEALGKELAADGAATLAAQTELLALLEHDHGGSCLGGSTGRAHAGEAKATDNDVALELLDKLVGVCGLGSQPVGNLRDALAHLSLVGQRGRRGGGKCGCGQCAGADECLAGDGNCHSGYVLS